MLNWLKKGAYKTLSEVLAAIRKEIVSLQPRDTDSIKWTKGLAGMEAHVVNVGGVDNTETTVQEETDISGLEAEYKSSFKLIFGMTTEPEPDPDAPPEEEPEPFVPERCLLLVQGADESDENAGMVTSPSIFQSIYVKKTELPIETGEIYLIITWSITEGLTYSIGEYVPISGSSISIRIGSYDADSDTIHQIHVTGDITINDWPYMYQAYNGAFTAVMGTTVEPEPDPEAPPFDPENPPEPFVPLPVIYICYGSDFDNPIAGYVGPSPINIAVPKTQLPASDGTIYLLVAYAEGAYTASFIQGAYTPGAQEWMTPIASYNSSTKILTQVHTTGNITILERWL